ncbi:MAG: tRNA dihydrouridine synthase [Rhabdochlamydiaceae bacterium]
MLLAKSAFGCPYLMLAPMEGVGDQFFRQAMAFVGGFDEAIADFLRVPRFAHVESLAKVYEAEEMSPYPMAAQLMGAEPDLIALMAREIEKRGAKHINLNCGCPSGTVTGKGAGSSLLKDPSHLHAVAKALVDSVSVTVSVKMRSGYDDTSLFKENLLAAQESGADYVILHPRTKQEGYGPPADWRLIKQAKEILQIPVVGNGDILSVEDAIRMYETTGCDALMIGRGALVNPFIFREIKAHYAQQVFHPCWSDWESYLKKFLSLLPSTMTKRTQINKLKQLMSFVFKGSLASLSRKQMMLTAQYEEPSSFLNFCLDLLKEFVDQ